MKRLKEENYALKSRLVEEASDKVAFHRHAAAAVVRDQVNIAPRDPKSETLNLRRGVTMLRDDLSEYSAPRPSIPNSSRPRFPKTLEMPHPTH